MQNFSNVLIPVRSWEEKNLAPSKKNRWLNYPAQDISKALCIAKSKLYVLKLLF